MARRCDLTGMDQERLIADLDACLLDHHELALGETGWSRFEDPFPEWEAMMARHVHNRPAHGHWTTDEVPYGYEMRDGKAHQTNKTTDNGLSLSVIMSYHLISALFTLSTKEIMRWTQMDLTVGFRSRF